MHPNRDQSLLFKVTLNLDLIRLFIRRGYESCFESIANNIGALRIFTPAQANPPELPYGSDKVPSWHHQAIRNVDNTRLVVTAQTETNGIQLIEAVERPDKTFCIGVQYHPEVAVKKHLDKEEDAGSFMGYDEAMALFNALLEASRKY